MSQLKIKDGNNWIDIPAGGIGVPSGGTTGQLLMKSSSTDYATEWADIPQQRGWISLGVVTESTIGKLSVGYNPYIHLAYCFFQGNGTTPSSGSIQWDAQNYFKVFRCECGTRYSGGLMSVGGGGGTTQLLRAAYLNNAWDVGYIMFATYDEVLP